MKRERLAEIENLMRALRPKVGSAPYAEVLALTAYVRELEAIRDAAEELLEYGGKSYIDQLTRLLDAQAKDGG